MKRVQLLVRPRWFPGESWAGYLLRVANANEIPGIRCLADMLGVSESHLLTNQPRAVLAALGWSERAPLVRYTVPTASRSRLPPEEGRQMLVRSGRRLATAICPRCLASDPVPYQRALWEGPLEVGCRTHRTELLRRCTACNHTLQADRCLLLECPCGASLLEQEARALDGAWREILPAFGLKRPEAAAQTFRPICGKEIVAASVVERLAIYEIEKAPILRKQRVSAKPGLEAVELAAPWFQDWPRGFENRYRQALEHNKTAEGRCNSYIQAKTLFAPMFPPIQRVVARLARARSCGPQDAKVRDVEYYLSCANQSVSAVCKLLGLSRAQVVWLLSTGAMPGAKRLSRHAFSIPTETVLDLMAHLSQTEDWLRAATRRGLHKRAMKQILRIGLIPAVSLSDFGICRIEPGPWDDFCDLLLACAKPLPGAAFQTIQLEAVIAASQAVSPDASRTARIVGAIARGEMEIYASSKRPKMLNELLVSMSQLKRVAPRYG